MRNLTRFLTPWIILISSLSIVAGLVGCGQNGEENGGDRLTVVATTQNSPVSPPPTPTATPPEVAADEGAIQARLISNVTQQPVGGTQFYLLPAVGDLDNPQVPPLLTGPNEDDVQGFTEDDGWLVLNNIPPGDYFLILWAPLSWVPLAEGTGPKVGKAILLNVEPGQTLNFGEMIILWP